MPKKKTIKVEVSNGEGGTILIELSNTDYDFGCEYLINGLNATRAYMKTHPESSYDSARSSSSELLAKPNIVLFINDRMKKKAMQADEVVARLSDIARGNHLPFIKVASDGFIYFDFSQPEAKDYMHLIKKIETKRERRIEGAGADAEEWEGEWVKVELHDAHAALRDLGRWHKLFVDRVENSGFSIEIPWDELTPEQIIRLEQGVDPAVIKKEVDERKSIA